MNDQVKTAVFFCTCGHTLNDYFDMKALLNYAGSLPGVVYSESNRFLCTRGGLDWLKTKITQSGCNRVVIAGCSPQRYEEKFMRALEDAGINKYLLSIANIREGCAWVIPKKESLMPGAEEIIASAIKRVAFAKPVEKFRKRVNPSALIIGAGLAGVLTALELQNLGIRPVLIEKKAQVSREKHIFLTPDNLDINAREMFSAKIKELRERAIELLTSTEIKEVKGNPGAFQVTLDTMGQEKIIEVGAIVVSTGFQRQVGDRVNAMRSTRRIVSLLQLHDMFDFEQRTLERILVTPDKRIKYACFILGDSETTPKTNTIIALNDAIHLKEMFKTEVVIAARDISVSGTEIESLYRRAREEGVLFYKYTDEYPPEFKIEKGVITFLVKDPALSQGGDGQDFPSIAFPCELLALEDKILPGDDFEHLKNILQVNLNQWGFFQEKNIHLLYNLSNRKGIFFTGSCHGEEDIYDIINDVRSVAMNIYSLLSSEYMELEKRVVINTDKCVLCLTCLRSCPHKAIEISDGKYGVLWGAQVNVEACKGCGICAGECPAKAIEMLHYSDAQIFSELAGKGVR